VIDRVTLLLWLAHNDDKHVGAYCDLIADGLLLVHSDLEQVTGLAITPSGAAMLRTLPATTA
jgi:hypothetical protein